MNDTSPLLLSVLVLSYNHQAYIAECVHSIWDQDYPYIEIIVLDDGSDDNSYNIAKKMITNSPFKMQVIQQKNTGLPSLNVNRMAFIAQGSLFAITAADDKFSENSLSSLVDVFIKNKNTQLVYSNGYKWINNCISESDLVHNAMLVDLLQKQNPKLVYDYLTTDIPELYIQSCIIKKDTFFRMGGFDETLLADDWVFNIRLFKYLMENNQSFCFLNIPAFYYRLHDSNSNKNIDRMTILIYQVADKYIQPYYRRKYIIAKAFSNAIFFYLKNKKILLALGYFFDKRNTVFCLLFIFRRIISKIKKF